MNILDKNIEDNVFHADYSMFNGDLGTWDIIVLGFKLYQSISTMGSSKIDHGRPSEIAQLSQGGYVHDCFEPPDIMATV